MNFTAKQIAKAALLAAALTAPAAAQNIFTEDLANGAVNPDFSWSPIPVPVNNAGNYVVRVTSGSYIVGYIPPGASIPVFPVNSCTLRARHVGTGSTSVTLVGTTGSTIVAVPSTNWTPINSNNYPAIGMMDHIVLQSSSGGEFDDIVFDIACQSNGSSADYNQNAFIEGQDWDAYVNDFINGNMAADWDQDGFLTSIDYDCFLFAFFHSCP